jgi:redox-sensitive bicupin YhaK (pirin superfamily)
MERPDRAESELHVLRAQDRGRGGASWLDSRHSFSFATYFDPNRMGFRGLRVINEDRIAPGAGFPTHPHREMEILTWLLSGELEHRDSTGASGVLRPGMMQHMSAGSGVAHSEFNGSRSAPLHLLQIWLLPTVRGGTPRYEDRDFSGRFDDRWCLLASPDGVEGSLVMRNADAVRVARISDGTTLRHTVSAEHGVWIQVARGHTRINGRSLAAGDALFSESVDELEVTGVEGAEVLLFELA